MKELFVYLLYFLHLNWREIQTLVSDIVETLFT